MKCFYTWISPKTINIRRKVKVSFHFGGSRNHVSLHTAVLYIGNDIGTKSFCTISDGMEHNPLAIWSPIKPILQTIMR